MPKHHLSRPYLGGVEGPVFPLGVLKQGDVELFGDVPDAGNLVVTRTVRGQLARVFVNHQFLVCHQPNSLDRRAKM